MQDIQEFKKWVIITHLSALSAFLIPLANIVLPFLIMLIQKDKMPSFETECKKIINAQLSYTIYGFVLFCFNFIAFAISPTLIAITIPLQFVLCVVWLGLILFAAFQTHLLKSNFFEVSHEGSYGKNSTT